MNNKSLGMIRHFQEMYFDSNFVMTNTKKGYNAPDFTKIAKAYGLDILKTNTIDDLSKLNDKIGNNKPLLVDISLRGMTYVYPKLVFGRPTQEQEPLLDKILLEKVMNLL